MLKTENSPNNPSEIFSKDYQAPSFLIKNIDLTVKIFDGHSMVTSVLTIERNGEHSDPLKLDGAELELQEVKIDETVIDDSLYSYNDHGLEIATVPDQFTLETTVKIHPEKNTALEGLYKSSVIYCTQCESEGFRKITFYPDRPDVLSKFTTRIEADKKTCPILLSNGNKIDEGKLKDGRHFTVWEDPFLKPCYLFALVAGDLGNISDTFTTKSGQKVDLKIYTEKGNEDKCHHAMDSLKRSMKWDEDVYGREYDLNIFNIVAVGDFNFGAMENKSLNIFNTSTVFASQETATDSDFLRVEAVVAHEYFHNWSGNRVTCRDWFQLSLKEGLTVFRDQSFSADMNSATVQRIQDVNFLKNFQFKEDASPMAHPVRPESYIDINNFYTVTVYEKGSEIIRMMHQIMGADLYRKGTDLYFDRHDGQAVTCDDFARAMEDASGVDLSQFKLWYSQAGTPRVKASGHYNADQKTYTLTLEQTIPDTVGQTDKQPMHIPVKIGLVSPDGTDMILNEQKETSTLLHLREAKQEFVFENIDEKPTPSILREFSAPVHLETDLTEDDLLFLMKHDSDGFNRWESGQTCATRLLLGLIKDYQENKDFRDVEFYINALSYLIDHKNDDKMLLASSLQLPAFSYLAQQMSPIDVDAIYEARKYLRKQIAVSLKHKLQSLYDENNENDQYDIKPISVGRRALKNLALSYLSALDDDTAVHLAHTQYQTADNMTDRSASLSVLSQFDTPQTAEVLNDFYQRFENEALVIDKWFAAQAIADRPDAIQQVRNLMERDDFIWTNPNRVRSVLRSFAANAYYFHSDNGKGYELMADAIIKLNGINPSIAAAFARSLQEWRKYDNHRQGLMKKHLERILDTENLSKNVFEIVSRALK